jgi:negative regulator of genetic competence, sporulation and motility
LNFILVVSKLLKINIHYLLTSLKIFITKQKIRKELDNNYVKDEEKKKRKKDEEKKKGYTETQKVQVSSDKSDGCDRPQSHRYCEIITALCKPFWGERGSNSRPQDNSTKL